MKTITRQLDVELSDREVHAFATTLAVKVKELRVLEAEKKVSASKFADDMKELNTEIDMHTRRVNTKKDTRGISCTWHLSTDGQTKTLVRNDTGETVQVDVATDADRKADAVLPGMEV